MFSFFTYSRYWYGMSRNARANNTAFPLSVRTDKPAQIRIQRPKNTTFNTGLHCLPLTYHLISSPKISKIIRCPGNAKYEAQLSGGTKRKKDEEQALTKQTQMPYMKSPTYKERRTATEAPPCNDQ